MPIAGLPYSITRESNWLEEFMTELESWSLYQQMDMFEKHEELRGRNALKILTV